MRARVGTCTFTGLDVDDDDAELGTNADRRRAVGACACACACASDRSAQRSASTSASTSTSTSLPSTNLNTTRIWRPSAHMLDPATLSEEEHRATTMVRRRAPSARRAHSARTARPASFCADGRRGLALPRETGQAQPACRRVLGPRRARAGPGRSARQPSGLGLGLITDQRGREGSGREGRSCRCWLQLHARTAGRCSTRLSHPSSTGLAAEDRVEGMHILPGLAAGGSCWVAMWRRALGNRRAGPAPTDHTRRDDDCAQCAAMGTPGRWYWAACLPAGGRGQDAEASAVGTVSGRRPSRRDSRRARTASVKVVR